MPGMFNCHYHASYRNIGSTGLPIGMEGSPGYLTIGGAYNIALALNSGFTGVISAGAPHAIDASLRKAVEEGLIPGPRIMTGSRDVSTTAHSQDRAFPWYWEGGQHPGICKCDGPDGFRRGVREEIKRGAEYIKIFATAGHAVKGDPELLEVSPDELAAAIHAAHERGVRVRAHIANKHAIMTATKLGIDAIDHGVAWTTNASRPWSSTARCSRPAASSPTAWRKPPPTAPTSSTCCRRWRRCWPSCRRPTRPG